MINIHRDTLHQCRVRLGLSGSGVRRAVRWTAILATRLLPALVLTGCLGPDFSGLTRDEHVSPAAAECGECHREIYKEWQHSSHANSYLSAPFAAATADHSFARCLPCHVPDSIYADGPPRARESRLEEGVSCLVCHLDGSHMVGPMDSSALVLPHPVSPNGAFFRDSRLCGTCHVGTYRESLKYGAEKSCQDCHMRPVKRKNTQSTDSLSKVLVAFEDEGEGRRHDFSLDGMVSLPDDVMFLALSLERDATGEVAAALTLRHQLAHAMPTGDFGFREVVLEVAARDGVGGALAVRERRFYRELGNALAPGQDHTFRFSLPASTRSAVATLYRTGRDGSGRLDLRVAEAALTRGVQP